MAVITMTMEEARAKWTPEKRREQVERLKTHIDVYDPDCPPSTEEKLKNFRRVDFHRKNA